MDVRTMLSATRHAAKNGFAHSLNTAAGLFSILNGVRIFLLSIKLPPKDGTGLKARKSFLVFAMGLAPVSVLQTSDVLQKDLLF